MRMKARGEFAEFSKPRGKRGGLIRLVPAHPLERDDVSCQAADRHLAKQVAFAIGNRPWRIHDFVRDQSRNPCKLRERLRRCVITGPLDTQQEFLSRLWIARKKRSVFRMAEETERRSWRKSPATQGGSKRALNGLDCRRDCHGMAASAANPSTRSSRLDTM